MNWNFKKETPYFVMDPEGDGMSYFETIEERDRYAKECLMQYLADGWDPEVVNLVAGVVTHSAQEVDHIDRPLDLDEDGCDDEGVYWDPDWEYVCDYKMLPVEREEEKVDITNKAE